MRAVILVLGIGASQNYIAGASARAQEESPVCKPSVSMETETAPGGQVSHFVQATNSCECEVRIFVRSQTAADEGPQS